MRLRGADQVMAKDPSTLRDLGKDLRGLTEVVPLNDSFQETKSILESIR